MTEVIASQDKARLLHGAFEIGITAKALVAAAETLSGIGLFFIRADWVHAMASWLTAGEMGEDPTDWFGRWVMKLAMSFDVSTQHFWAAYLIGHGVVKLFAIGALVAGFRWAYPLSMAVLGGFILWQMQKWLVTGSLFMLGISVFDAFIIWLIWQEWRSIRAPH